jgi:hypothetical protein
LQTTWPTIDKNDACSDDLAVAIIKIITGNTIPLENHLILPKDLFRLNPKQLEKLRKIKEMCPPHLLIPDRRAREEE